MVSNKYAWEKRIMRVWGYGKINYKEGDLEVCGRGWFICIRESKGILKSNERFG